MVREVLCLGGVSATIPSTNGVKQGCLLSPALFGLHIQETERYVHQSGRDGIDLSCPQGHIMLYADDVLFISKSHTRSSHTYKFSIPSPSREDLSLTMKLAKTKVTILHTSRSVQRHSCFTLEKSPVEVVDSYVNLGITFTSTMG